MSELRAHFPMAHLRNNFVQYDSILGGVVSDTESTVSQVAPSQLAQFQRKLAKLQRKMEASPRPTVTREDCQTFKMKNLKITYFKNHKTKLGRIVHRGWKTCVTDVLRKRPFQELKNERNKDDL